jgi:hypothetical protein
VEKGGIMNRPQTLSELFDYLSRGWRREHFIRDTFGACPDCKMPDTIREGWKYNYRVLTVDSFSWAVCDDCKTRWFIGYLQLGPSYLDAEAPRLALNPEYLATNEKTREIARFLLTYRDVTDEVEAFCARTMRGEAYRLEDGLEARAEGIIRYLECDSMCFFKRDADGHLVEDNPWDKSGKGVA